ncbi:BhlA/UviB family holin-like peptide [Heyndrickxia sporothermodurans]|uniref:Holin n=1 Tax=Heyndrickxia sporothermodurans TaxID=46224 RepID=A0AB37HE13_9BACI|nr:BhlA/UviB family holin-like peptide [Heyndrickxia sporothermodurans]MBL5769287.1 holin [Heyndrickxia sporothermodurans]MBL5773065.1 holin [Heyndrickxia sporothermodurans]MBL5776558.1 holin [Heyndrickxia sporothermodurans]MBL5783662.1 holin [Heyndrickxia sporothermodurans]MBL5787161.1 holin [Heyndrickxia sporothermodurans]
MDLSSIPFDTWLGQGIFCLLFVWLLFDTRKEAKAREDKLSAQIDKQNIAQEKIVLSLQRMETQIEEIKEGK